MFSSRILSLFASATFIARVYAHGIVTGVVVDGIWHSGYNPSFQYQNPPPVVAGWSIPQDQDLGFVNDYSSPDIVCHKAATPGGAYITVPAGHKVTLEWTNWPVSHHGPVMDYLASCNGDCTTVDKTKLLFNKIDEAGLIDGSPAPGTWASDTLIANNNSWTVTIPPTIAPGKYVLRHETIALHSAENLDGSQAYPQCINLDITGSGTNTLSSGTFAEKLYKDTDPGILVNIYYPALTNYTIPGPPLIADAVSESQPSGPAPASLTTTPSASYSSSQTGKSPTATTSAHATFTYSTPSSVALPTSYIPPPSTHEAPISTSSTPATTHPTYHPSLVSASPVSSTSVASHPTYHPSFTSIAPVLSSSVIPTSSNVWSEWSYSASSSTVAAPTTTSSLIDKPWPPLPNSSAVSPVGGSPTSTTNYGAISFTSTITGRIGRPTKFTCYIDE